MLIILTLENMLLSRKSYSNKKLNFIMLAVSILHYSKLYVKIPNFIMARRIDFITISKIMHCVTEIFLLIFGITIIIYSAKYDAFNNDVTFCWNVNYWLIVGGCLAMMPPVFSCCGLTSFDKDNADGEVDCGIKIGNICSISIAVDAFHISQFVCGIWAAVIYHQIDTECKELIMDVYPAYWTFILIYYSIMWIVVIFLVFGCIFLIHLGVKNNNQNDNELLNIHHNNSKYSNTDNA